MSQPEVPTGISVEDWEKTPATVKALLESLLARLGKLEEQSKQNSQNTSKPPSSDQGINRSLKKGSGKKQGGQPGHKGHYRALRPISEVDKIVISRPVSCAGCGSLLLGQDETPQRHQVSDIPVVKPSITEYQRHTLKCVCCGKSTQAEWPSGMPEGEFGTSVEATVGYLSGEFGLSQRETQEALEGLFGLEIGLGSVSRLENQVSEALEAIVEEATAEIKNSPSVNVDETGWREKGQRSWLWVARTKLLAVFTTIKTRGKTGWQSLLGADYAGIVGSDRWSAYNGLATKQRQLCWAHLKRDFQKISEREGESAEIGKALLEAEAQTFKLWQQVKLDQLDRTQFRGHIGPICNNIHALLVKGSLVKHPQTASLCKNLLKIEGALWTFVDTLDVEPTNNRAEQAIRPAVLWRRRCFGTQSITGSSYVSRILTVTTTLRLQHRNVLAFLTQACHSALTGLARPSLLPQK